jgi:hypothetical protein
MRFSTYVLGVTAAFGAAAAGFAGCGGTVSTENAGSTTGAGTGGTITTMVTVTASVSSTATTTSASSSSTSTSSSSSGGDPACDAACTHVAQCNLGFTCAQLPANYNCSTVGTQYDCVFECINALSCSQILSQGMACLTATCSDGGTTMDGGGPGDGGVGPTDGGVGPGDGGIAVSACTMCATAQCIGGGQGPLAKCGLDSTCLGWAGCINACNSESPPTASCFQTCDATYASASALYDPVYVCTCSMCGTECATSDPCDHGMDGGP